MAEGAGVPRLRVLVTNDDGIEAPALAELAAHLSAAGHDVQVAAPSVEHTGCGASIGKVSERFLVPAAEVTLPGAPGVAAVSVDAPPALAVIAGCLGLFGPPPAVVVSGTNSGYNTGPTMLHSGTLGAALTAAANGVPGIALSTERAARHGFTTAAALCAGRLVELAGAVGAGSVLNVNVPDRPLEALAGVRWTRIRRQSLVSVTVLAEPGGLRIRRVRAEEGLEDDSDGEAITNGFVSVTRIHGGVWDLAPDPEEERAVLGLLGLQPWPVEDEERAPCLS